MGSSYISSSIPRQQVFRDVRSAWMTSDEAGWLGENDFYPGALECACFFVWCVCGCGNGNKISARFDRSLERVYPFSHVLPKPPTHPIPTPTTGMRHLLSSPSPSSPAPPVYVITTKGKEFTLKLLEGIGLKVLINIRTTCALSVIEPNRIVGYT